MAVHERPGAVTLRGNPFTLLGRELKEGDTAPDFTLVGAGMSEVTLKDSAGKVRLISCVPSLDTPVCSTETMKWEQQRGAMGEVEMLTVSMDLPFAQARW
jgi:thiol peroxidase